MAATDRQTDRAIVNTACMDCTEIYNGSCYSCIWMDRWTDRLVYQPETEGQERLCRIKDTRALTGSKDATQTHQQRPESATVTHLACKQMQDR